MGKLSLTQIKKITEAGKYSDGGGLYLVVSKGGTKSWVFRYMMGSNLPERGVQAIRREMGLGSLESVPIADARDRAYQARRLISEGKDPITIRDAIERDRRIQENKNVTFKTCALEFIENQKDSWTYRRHAETWLSSLKRFVFPIFGDILIREIDVALVTRALRPIWKTTHHTACKVQNRIENILDYATVLEYRSGDNPARWKGNLEYILPEKGEFAKTKHHPSLSYKELPAFYSRLISEAETTQLALAFLILTATRTQETLGATWSEFNIKDKLWTIPAQRMKADEEHVIPLSNEAVRVFEIMKARSQNPFVFPGRIAGKSLSNMVLLMHMRRMGNPAVPHGFRSTFKNWASEVYGAEDEVSEAALSHKIREKTKAAYLTGKFIDKRRELMEAWAKHCLSAMKSTSQSTALISEPKIDIAPNPSL